jgi:GGDEF domain-containing protein
MSMNNGAQTDAGAGAWRANDPDRVPHAFRHDWITFTMRRLEPWIAGSIALYTAWIAATVLTGATSLWLFVMYAALIAKCCDLRPAHYQAEMFIRALALVAGSFVLNTHAHLALDAAGGVFFFWLSITTLYYAFMLKPAWGAALVGVAMAALVAAAWYNGTASWAALAAPLGFLAVFPLGVAMRFGVAMRRADEAIERSKMDAATGLYNLDGFMARGAETLNACAVDHRPVTMVVMDCADLQEVRTIYGRQTSRKVMARLVRKLNAIAGDRGVVARMGPCEFAVLLPGLARDKACLAIDRVLGRPGCIEYDAGDSEVVMVPNFVVSELNCEPDGLHLAYTQQRAQVQQRIQQQAEHERYLTQERERHSRPAPLAPLAPLSNLPPTIPAPLPALQPMRSLATTR